MQRLRLAWLLSAAGLLLPPAAAACIAVAPPATALTALPVVDPARLGTLRNGDVIFLAAPQALWARLASQWSLPQFRHGHVGIVIVEPNGRVGVVHAGGDPTQSRAVVREVAVRDFLHEAQSASVFRMKDPAAAQATAAAARSFAAARIPFDTEFSLQSRDSLYCTEMVWRAMSAALHRDAVPRKHVEYGRAAIRLSDLESSPDLELVVQARAVVTAPL
ncbi:MAG: hypothetical protein K1X35_06985 [Caulobacteraceae bacterium]|nr:hypothetical protein [Caulobacteraceae bacterium]